MTSSSSDCNVPHIVGHHASATELHQKIEVHDYSGHVQRQEPFNTETEPERDEVLPGFLESCGSRVGLVKELLPDNVLCWRRRLLEHSRLYFCTP